MLEGRVRKPTGPVLGLVDSIRVCVLQVGREEKHGGQCVPKPEMTPASGRRTLYRFVLSMKPRPKQTFGFWLFLFAFSEIKRTNQVMSKQVILVPTCKCL